MGSGAESDTGALRMRTFVPCQTVATGGASRIVLRTHPWEQTINAFELPPFNLQKSLGRRSRCHPPSSAGRSCRSSCEPVDETAEVNHGLARLNVAVRHASTPATADASDSAEGIEVVVL